MPGHPVFAMKFAKVYPLYVAKAERKGRTRADVDRVICWLTGYDPAALARQVERGCDVETFFAESPRVHPDSALIRGVVCGVCVEEVEDPLMRRIRQLDKLIDELAKGRPLEKILHRTPEAAAARKAPRSPAPPEGAAATRTTKRSGKVAAKAPRLLSGGNPQIAKADGDAPVQAYIAAVPGWKRDVVRRLDALVTELVPGVRKAVRWNSPFYGVEGRGWIVSIHVFTRYVKVTFFAGTELRPPPAGGTRDRARWVDVPEAGYDEAQMASWMRQAAALPGGSGS